VLDLFSTPICGFQFGAAGFDQVIDCWRYRLGGSKHGWPRS
jgi:hypothetical protein